MFTIYTFIYILEISHTQKKTLLNFNTNFRINGSTLDITFKFPTNQTFEEKKWYKYDDVIKTHAYNLVCLYGIFHDL